MKLLLNLLIFKIWLTFFYLEGALATSNLLGGIGYSILLDTMILLKPASPDTITINIQNMKIQRQLRGGLI